MSGNLVDSAVATAKRISARPATAAKRSRPAASPATPAAKDQQMNDTVKAFADQAQDQTRSTMDKAKNAAEEMAAFGKGNVEALVEASRIAARGFETMGQDAAAYAKSSYEATSAALKSMTSASSPAELMKLQADFFRTAFDTMVKEASRSTEASLKLAGEVAAPIQNRLAIAADKIKVAA
jgi:phasin family protein